jgi:uncharacterized SAM-binding protein YcdF (DUF218 family)
MNSPEADALAKQVWDYHHLNHQLKPTDCILVLGSNDLRVAEGGAQLFLEGWAPLLVFSGGLGRLTRKMWREPEADRFARVAREMGVPPEKILVENRSSNTGENILLTRELLAKLKLEPQTVLLVQKPYMERRAYATFKKLWPEAECIVTSPQISFEDYPTGEISKEDVINIMVGDLQRIRLYPALGFQIPQTIPDDVWQAYETLVELGYRKHLIHHSEFDQAIERITKSDSVPEGRLTTSGL